MSNKVLIVRETAVSVLINTVLSILFFMLVFGLSNRVGLSVFGTDFLPQSFMIALMGSLVPSLILRKHTAAAIHPIILRAIAFAVGATIAGGGASFAICRMIGGSIDPMTGLVVKAIYGAVLAGIVTPLALRAQLRS